MNQTPQDTTRQAAGMLAIARARLVRSHPFHARFLASWREEASSAVPTMGVTVRDGRILLAYNPEFVVGCSYLELGGVLQHEVNHVLFRHVFMDASRFPDAHALVIAQEVTANEWIREPLPGTPLLLAQFPQLPLNEDTLTRYRRLVRDQFLLSWDQNSGAGVPNCPASEPESVKTGPISGEPCMLDDHGLWETALASGKLGALAVQVEIRDAADALSPEEWAQIPPELARRIRASVWGVLPGDACEAMTPVAVRGMDWRALLRRYVRTATARQPLFNRPPRRFPELVGIVPGHAHRPDRAAVMAVMDTSASMDTALLEQISAELALMARVHAVTVVECDARVHRVYPFAGSIRVVHGRGGTNFRPIFAPDLLRQIRPHVMVIFTDGDGSAPEQPPAVPVIWCLTSDGESPVRWGRELRLPPSHA